MDAHNSPKDRFTDVYESALELRSKGKYKKALEKFSRAVKLSDKLTEKDERIYDSLLGLARCHYRLGNSSEAEENYQLALSYLRKYFEESHKTKIASILWEIAVLYTDQKRFEEAALFFKNSIVITSKFSGPNDRFIADCLWGMSKCFCALGNLNAAENAIRTALEIYLESESDVNHPILVNRKNLASVLMEKGRYKEALSEIDTALKSMTAIYADEVRDFTKMYFRLAWCAQRNQDYKCADKSLNKAFKLTVKINGRNSPMTALAKLACAHNKNCLDKFDKAEKLLLESIKTLKKDDTELYKHDIGGALYELGQCYIKQKRFKKAISVLEELLAIHEDDPLFSPELFADTLHSLAHCYEKDLNLEKAKEMNQRSLFVKEQIYGAMHEEVAQSLFQLSSCLRKLDDLPEADFAKIRANEITEALFTAS